MERAEIAKNTRTFIRLKHPLPADVEINDVLPDTLEEFDALVANGTLKELQASVTVLLWDDDTARDQ